MLTGRGDQRAATLMPLPPASSRAGSALWTSPGAAAPASATVRSSDGLAVQRDDHASHTSTSASASASARSPLGCGIRDEHVDVATSGAKPTSSSRAELVGVGDDDDPARRARRWRRFRPPRRGRACSRPKPADTPLVPMNATSGRMPSMALNGVGADGGGSEPAHPPADRGQAAPGTAASALRERQRVRDDLDRPCRDRRGISARRDGSGRRARVEEDRAAEIARRARRSARRPIAAWRLPWRCSSLGRVRARACSPALARRLRRARAQGAGGLRGWSRSRRMVS